MGVGRPTKYDEQLPMLAAKLAKEGKTLAEIADFLDVAMSTVSLWKEKHKEFSEAIKAGNQLSDDEVERSLYKRANGYTRQIERMGKDGREMCAEELPPDPVSMIFWLKNRRPQKWRDKQEHEVSGKDGGPIQAVINFGTRPKDK